MNMTTLIHGAQKIKTRVSTSAPWTVTITVGQASNNHEIVIFAESQEKAVAFALTLGTNTAQLKDAEKVLERYEPDSGEWQCRCPSCRAHRAYLMRWHHRDPFVE